jgi:hypothetical protein
MRLAANSMTEDDINFADNDSIKQLCFDQPEEMAHFLQQMKKDIDEPC